MLAAGNKRQANLVTRNSAVRPNLSCWGVMRFAVRIIYDERTASRGFPFTKIHNFACLLPISQYCESSDPWCQTERFQSFQELQRLEFCLRDKLEKQIRCHLGHCLNLIALHVHSHLIHTVCEYSYEMFWHLAYYFLKCIQVIPWLWSDSVLKK